MRTKPAIAALIVGLSMTLAACGEDDSSSQPAPSRTEHNEADVEFAQEMIPHHAQAGAMADLTRGRELDPQVQALADEILMTQTPQIETMSDWLTSWDEEVPETMRDHMAAEEGGSHTDMGADDMSGMMSEEEMAELEQASDAAFQDMWLGMMVEHHQGAIEMAEAEQVDGQYKPAIDLAEEIEAAQSKEISTMEQLLG